MKISCIIPTCDRQDLLKEALQSIFNQTFKPYEIIIINNGLKEIELPNNQDPTIKIFRIIPYAGVAQARNFGACQATGDYLAFLDDDDLWNVHYLENIEQAIKEKTNLILISRLDKMESGEIMLHRYANSNNLTIPYVLESNPGFNGSNIVISKKLFFDLGGFDPKLPPSEDKGLLMEAMIKKATIISLPENQAILRIHEGVPRLTNSAKMAEGIFQFTRKYSHLMNWHQFFFNWKKIYRYRFKSGNKISAVSYFLTNLLLKITSFLQYKPHMNFCARPSKTFQFDVLKRELSKLNGEIGIDAASETMKNRKMFKTKKYYGLDFNLDFLKRGLEKNKSENTFGIWSDLAKLDQLSSNSADVIVSTNTLNILSKENRVIALKHLCRITAPRGSLILDHSIEDKTPLREIEGILNCYFKKIKIIYTGNLLSRRYEKIFEKNGWLGSSHPIAGAKPFLLLSWLISRLEYLTCHTAWGNNSAFIICTNKKTNEPKNKFDTSQFKIIDKNLFNLFN